MPVQKFTRNTNEIEALQLLDSNEVDDATWDQHVTEIQEFLGETVWDGDDTGIYISGADSSDEGVPTDWVIKELGEFYILSNDQFQKLHTRI